MMLKKMKYFLLQGLKVLYLLVPILLIVGFFGYRYFQQALFQSYERGVEDFARGIFVQVDNSDCQPFEIYIDDDLRTLVGADCLVPTQE